MLGIVWALGPVTPELLQNLSYHPNFIETNDAADSPNYFSSEVNLFMENPEISTFWSCKESFDIFNL